MAWKFYHGEIGGEVTALIDDQIARDLARRCFHLAEIFLDEKVRRPRDCQALPFANTGIGGMVSVEAVLA